MSPTPIEYQKVMSEVVFINLPAPEEPMPGMSGPETLHGFLAEFHRTKNEEVKAFCLAFGLVICFIGLAKP